MLKNRFMLQFGSTFVVQIVGMVSGIIIARIAGPSVMGLLSYAMSIVSVFGFINGIFGNAHIKLVSEGRDHLCCINVYRKLQLISSVIYLCMGLLIILLMKLMGKGQLSDNYVLVIVLLALFTHFFNMYEQYSNTVYVALQKQAKANVYQTARTLLWYIGRVILVIFGFRALGLSIYGLLLGLLFLPVYYSLLREHPITHFNLRIAKKYYAYAKPTVLQAISRSLYQYSDKLLLVFFASIEELGFYSAAFALGGMFLLVSAPVGSIFFPLFSSLIAKNKWEEVTRTVSLYQDMVNVFILPLVVVFAVSGWPIVLLILGQQYQPSIRPMIVLVFSTYITLMGLPYSSMLHGMGKFYTNAWIGILKVALIFAFLPLLVYDKALNLGASGLAINVLVTSIVEYMFIMRAINKYSKVTIPSLICAKPVFVTLLVGCILYLASTLLDKYSVWWVWYFPISLIIMYVSLFATKCLTKEHIHHLIDLFNFRSVFNYAKDEMMGVK